MARAATVQLEVVQAAQVRALFELSVTIRTAVASYKPSSSGAVLAALVLLVEVVLVELRESM
jgi:hypothetical protein